MPQTQKNQRSLCQTEPQTAAINPRRTPHLRIIRLIHVKQKARLER
jgi:hypothetical protein